MVDFNLQTRVHNSMPAAHLAQWVRRWKRYRDCTAADIRMALGTYNWHHASNFHGIIDLYAKTDLLVQEARETLAAEIAARKGHRPCVRTETAEMQTEPAEMMCRA